MMSEAKDQKKLEETAVFILLAIKQFCFGFETLNDIAEEYTDGSPAKAFYLNAIYNYLSAFYLLDGKNKVMGGSFYPALKCHKLERLLDPIQDLMNTNLGGTRFGEVILTFRNKAIVHPGYLNSDLNRIYQSVDMQDHQIQTLFRQLLTIAYFETKKLGIEVARATGRPLIDFGIEEID